MLPFSCTQELSPGSELGRSRGGKKMNEGPNPTSPLPPPRAREWSTEVRGRQGLLPGDNVYLKNNKDSLLCMGLAHAQRARQAPFFIKNIPYRYSSYRMKNMSKGVTSFKFNKCPQAYKLKRDKMPVIPFLSLSPGNGIRWQEVKRSAWVRYEQQKTPREHIGVRPEGGR